MLKVDVVFDQPVNAFDPVTLTLATGTSRNASYVSGSGTTTLRFELEVGPNDSSDAVDYVSTTALSGGITGRTGLTATLDLPTPGGPGSLGAGPAIHLRSHLFDGAVSAAVDAAGKLYVSSDTNERVYKIDPVTHQLLWQTPDLTFTSPAGVHLFDSDATLLVADADGLLVSLNPASGEVLSSQSIPVGVFDFDRAANGDFWFAQSTTDSVLRFDSSLTQQQSLSGPFSTPYGVEISPTGDIYVAGATSQSVRRFTSAGDPVWDANAAQSPTSLVVRDGTVFVCSSRGAIDTISEATSIAGPTFIDGLTQPKTISDDRAGGFWVVSSADNHLDHVTPEALVDITLR